MNKYILNHVSKTLTLILYKLKCHYIKNRFKKIRVIKIYVYILKLKLTNHFKWLIYQKKRQNKNDYSVTWKKQRTE